MKCPHCLENFHPDFSGGYFFDKSGSWLSDKDGQWSYVHTVCPACNCAAIFIKSETDRGAKRNQIRIWPKGIARAPLPKEVPEALAADYREACLVLADSPKASAALSRRCLQHLLREKAGVKKSDLSKEIDEVINSNTLPSDLAEAIDAIRNIGNFAAHPTKSTNTGEIVDVELGVAEWNLDVLEDLFDFYFVRPAKLAAKRTALNQKLAEADKPPMK